MTKKLSKRASIEAAIIIFALVFVFVYSIATDRISLSKIGFSAYDFSECEPWEYLDVDEWECVCCREERCLENEDCGSDYICLDTWCVERGVFCWEDSDCYEGYICDEDAGECIYDYCGDEIDQPFCDDDICSKCTLEEGFIEVSMDECCEDGFVCGGDDGECRPICEGSCVGIAEFQEIMRLSALRNRIEGIREQLENDAEDEALSNCEKECNLDFCFFINEDRAKVNMQPVRDQRNNCDFLCDPTKEDSLEGIGDDCDSAKEDAEIKLEKYLDSLGACCPDSNCHSLFNSEMSFEYERGIQECKVTVYVNIEDLHCVEAGGWRVRNPQYDIFLSLKRTKICVD